MVLGVREAKRHACGSGLLSVSFQVFWATEQQEEDERIQKGYCWESSAADMTD